MYCLFCFFLVSAFSLLLAPEGLLYSFRLPTLKFCFFLIPFSFVLIPTRLTHAMT